MKKIYWTIAICTLLLALTGCSDDKEEEAFKSEETITYKEQEIKVHYYYNEMADYIESVRDNPDQDKETLYIQKVKKAMVEHGEADDPTIMKMIGYEFLQAPRDLDTMEEDLQVLKGKQDTIHSSMKKAMEKSIEVLPGGNKTIYVVPSSSEFKSNTNLMNGVYGVVYGEYAILILIDPAFNVENLEYTIAHEYHHTVNFETHKSERKSNLDGVVVEGKADAFAKQIYPDVEIPSVDRLHPNKEKMVWDMISENPDTYNQELYDETFFGSREKKIPMWSNYRVGLQIMDAFLEKNPEVPIPEWTSMTTAEILERGKYAEKFE
ncbi:DUF2268 domain-containing protein [Rossellomorea marisflavi]|uniref:DUF2268 domain-containing protein n=1 Tax=Rossellomorea marisflavi TaxID=189381 RepID=A0A163LUX8_9BACI|nr:DUF2268 domain-containing putative Zn-dependent protease [Rossellomorea marisflavi]KML08324.1 hypothetical protein VL06_02395 [Rossellomorea marisflavi]KZE51107.1 hypothetical protein AV649_17235 [Rossellomorea marisflavi]QHA35077.1 hypothetical protein D5E69_04135 [Rossellomorea marisflavi]